MANKRHGHNKATKKKQGWNVTESKLRADLDSRERVDLNPASFSKLLEQKGVNVKVYRTSYCPNVKSVDGAEHEIDCPICNGSGWLDRQPLCTKAFLQSQDLEKMHHLEGFVDGNHVAMTFPIGIELQYFTLIELEDFTEIYIQRVLRTEGSDIDILKYNACRVNFLVDSSNTEYFQDSDFKINVNGDIEWISGGNKPADNVVYSIHYEAPVQYRAVRAMHVNRFSQSKIGEKVEHLKFPEQWLVAKEFLVRRKDQDGNDLNQGPYDNHEIVEDD